MNYQTHYPKYAGRQIKTGKIGRCSLSYSPDNSYCKTYKMKKIISGLAVLCILVSAACNTAGSPSKAETTADSATIPDGFHVPFTTAVNYFVRNDYKEDQLTNYRISTRQQFDSIFGAAATMGAEGKPTAIDFTKQDAIAVINPVSDSAVSLQNPLLEQEGGYIALSYDEVKGGKQSFTTRPFLLLLIDKKYKGTVTTVIKK